VDVLTATHVAAINALRDQQSEDGASDVQQMQQIVCGLTFEDTLNNAQVTKWIWDQHTFIHLSHNHIQVLGILAVTLCKFQVKTNSGRRQRMPARVWGQCLGMICMQSNANCFSADAFWKYVKLNHLLGVQACGV